jgi:hypothetical protein
MNQNPSILADVYDLEWRNSIQMEVANASRVTFPNAGLAEEILMMSDNEFQRYMRWTR